MLAKTIAVAVLLFSSSVALASDVSFDQQQFRAGAATLVEGALPSAAKEKARRYARPVAVPCTCQHCRS